MINCFVIAVIMAFFSVFRFKTLLLLVSVCLIWLVLNRLFADNSPPITQFNIESSVIPSDEIEYGGPGKDGIPAIDQPQFIEADQVNFLKPEDRVLGLNYQGIQKAYPIRILNWHEIVNDQFGDEPVLITYCPLCGSGVAFSANIADKNYHFGISGLIYNSDVLLYDRETESLWSQLLHQAVSGPMSGTRLDPIPVTPTRWLDWKNRYPDSLVLSTKTGHIRNYQHDPYQNYQIDRKLWFPVAETNYSYHPKTWVLGIDIEGQAKAYPFSELMKMPSTFNDTLSQTTIKVKFDKSHQSAEVFDNNGSQLPAVTTFWFAWYAFHPETLIFEAKNNE